MRGWRATAGARIVGGCCGTTPVHLAAMRAALDGSPPGPTPDLATIEATLGALGLQATGRGDAPRGTRRRARA